MALPITFDFSPSQFLSRVKSAVQPQGKVEKAENLAVDAGGAVTDVEDTAVSGSSVEEFLDFMNKTPAERMRALILKKMDVTEDQLAAMAPEERLKIEEKIKAEIRNSIKRGSVMVDVVV